MCKKPKLSGAERLEIKILLDKGYSLRAISLALCRGHNTVSYEIKANGGENDYNPQNANQYARTRKKDTRREWSKIEHEPDMKKYIIEGLKNHWNPDEISGRMRQEKKPWYISKTAIYSWLRGIYGQQFCQYLYSGRYHTRKREKKTERVIIPNRVSVTERPASANNRTEAGHWERDTIVSRKGCSGGISTGVERVTRLLDGTKVKSMSASEHMQAVKKQKDKFFTLSETYDNGIENRDYQSTGIPSYFCQPYHSWEKGSIENANKMIRRYFPKGTNFRKVSQKLIDQIVFIINSKPRKILGYKTALEVAEECGIIKSLSVVNHATVLIGG